MQKWNNRNDKLTKDYEQNIEAIRKNYATLLLTLKKLEFNLNSSTLAKVNLSDAIRLELDEIRKAKLLSDLSEGL